jgi:hemoglobin
MAMNAATPVTQTEIDLLVDRFYAKVRQDDEIGPIFNANVENWDAHLSLLKDFWSTVLLTSGRYKGNPLVAHFPLPIEQRHFARWFQLFTETAHEVMSAQHARQVVHRAQLIAENMKRVLATKSSGPVP